MNRRPINPTLKCEAIAGIIATLVSAIVVSSVLLAVLMLGVWLTGG